MRITDAIKEKVKDWFGPSEPIAPVAQEAKGRSFDYQFAHNIAESEPRAAEVARFDQLRWLADNFDPLRLLIETRKDQLSGLEWSIKYRDEDKQQDATTEAITEFLRRPDRQHSWAEWLRMVVEDMLVTDAATVYMHRSRNGGLYSLEQIDGATIVPLLRHDGRRPTGDAPAYKQVLKGVPAVDYMSHELIYKPRNPRIHKVYGFSPVEQVLNTVAIGVKRALHVAAYYDEGSVPDALVGVPTEWTVRQIETFQNYWDTYISGPNGKRRRTKFVPGDMAKNFVQTTEPPLKDQYDEWLIRICCYAFSVEPTPFVSQVNRATAETAREQALEEGLEPLKLWVKDLIDQIIQTQIGVAGVEFVWTARSSTKPLDQAKIDEIYIKNGVASPSAIAKKRGIEPPTPEELERLSPAPKAAPALTATEPPTEPQAEKIAKADKASKELPPIDRDRKEAVDTEAELAAAMADFFEAEAQKVSVSDASEAAADAIADNIDWDGAAKKAVGPLSVIAEDGALAALVAAAPNARDSAMDAIRAKATVWAQNRSAELVGKKLINGVLVDNPNAIWAISDTTRDMIRSEVERALAEGLSTDELAANIRSSHAFSKSRAEMIARTEIAFADTSGQLIR